MKVRYRPNRNIEFEIEAEGQKEVFKELATTTEVFGESCCGNCESEDIYFRVRTVTAKEGKNKGKVFTYYEMVCHECGHYLPYGQHQQGGTLFPSRFLGAGDDKSFDKEHRGWRKQTGFQEEED